MTRPLRLEYEGAVYHITSRGNERGAVEIPKAQRRPQVAEVAAIKAALAGEFGRRPEELSRRRGGEDKMAAIYLCRALTMLTGVHIGKAFGVSGSQVSHVVGRVGATAGAGAEEEAQPDAAGDRRACLAHI
jgi:hypothetical protein